MIKTLEEHIEHLEGLQDRILFDISRLNDKPTDDVKQYQEAIYGKSWDVIISEKSIHLNKELKKIRRELKKAKK
jgi:hypothetical protein